MHYKNKNRSMTAQFDHFFKLVIIGDSGVGKSSLLSRFTTDVFIPEMQPTIGVDFGLKTLRVGQKTIKLSIWDTAGQERFRTLTSSYYRGCHGVILVFDVNSERTYTQVGEWLNEIETYSNRQFIKLMLVGNKIDLQKREVSTEEATAYANCQAMAYVESSAKTREGVDEAFKSLITRILDTPELLDTAAPTMGLPPPSQPLQPTYCGMC